MSNTLLKLITLSLVMNMMVGFVYDTYAEPKSVWNMQRAQYVVDIVDENSNTMEEAGDQLPKTDNNWQDNTMFGRPGKALLSMFRLLIRGYTIMFVPVQTETMIEYYVMWGVKIFMTIFNLILSFLIISIMWLKNYVWG